MCCTFSISTNHANSHQQERLAIQYEINATPTTNLQPPLDESTLLQELVAQFLAHDGYVETARAFAEEVATETMALQNGRNEPLKKYEVEEDHEAINRNSTSPSPIHPSKSNNPRNPLRNPRRRHRQSPQTHKSLLHKRPRRKPPDSFQTPLSQIPRNDASIQRTQQSSLVGKFKRTRRLRPRNGTR